jgi:hypothetical protein
MITITATNLLANEITTVEAKSISGAWNEIRKIRDQFKDDPTKGEGITLKINMGEMEPSDRLPLEIIFMTNKKGKLEFKDLQKIREKAMARMNEKDEDTEDYPDQGEEYMEKDLALSTL